MRAKTINNERIFPPSLQRKVDEYNAKGWWMGKVMIDALNNVNIDKLEDALNRTLQYANMGSSYINIDSNNHDVPIIQLCEIVEWGSNKFEKAPESVPYFEDIGEDKEVLFSYATLAAGADKDFTVYDIKDFIKMNK
jgi:hypothetical protein